VILSTQRCLTWKFQGIWNYELSASLSFSK